MSLDFAKQNSTPIELNLDELLFVRSAVEIALKKTNREEWEVFWPNANFADVLKQLDIAIDLLFMEKK